MKTLFKKVPVKYKGNVYAGFVSDDRLRVSLELKLGKLRRSCCIADDAACRNLFDEMIREIDAAGELDVLRPDPYLSELERASTVNFVERSQRPRFDIPVGAR